MLKRINTATPILSSVDGMNIVGTYRGEGPTGVKDLATGVKDLQG